MMDHSSGEQGAIDEIPPMALALGYGGLIPFYLPILVLFLGDPSHAALAVDAQRAYAAVILSFLGAVHWGVALARGAGRMQSRRMAWAVVPALGGWGALFLPGGVSQAVLMAGLAAAYWVDRRQVAGGWFPAWYGSLRFALSVGAIVALALGVLAAG